MRKGHPKSYFCVIVISAYVSIGDASITNNKQESLLSILIDSELSFDQHVSSTFSKASKKLHALGSITSFMSFEKRRALMKEFIDES